MPDHHDTATAYLAELEDLYGRGLTQDEFQEHTAVPAADADALVTDAVRAGDMLEYRIDDDTYLWTTDDRGRPRQADAFTALIRGESRQLKADDDRYRDGWADQVAAALTPVQVPADETPWDATLPRWDPVQTAQWAERYAAGGADWTPTALSTDHITGETALTVTADPRQDGSVTLRYTVDDHGDAATVQLAGVFRRLPDADWDPQPDARHRYLSSILTDIGAVDRHAHLNELVIDAAADINSRAALGRYRDVLDGLRDLDVGDRRGDAATADRMQTWARRKGQLQGLLAAKEADRDIPDSFRSDGALAAPGERDAAVLERYLAEVDARLDEDYLADADLYQHCGALASTLVDMVVREDTRLRQRDWPDALDDDTLLASVRDGRGGDASRHVRAKWDEYVDAYVRRMETAADAKLGDAALTG